MVVESADVVWNHWSHRWHSITIVSAIVLSKHSQTLSDSLSQFGLKKVELRLRAMQVWIWSILHNLARLRMVSHHAHIWFSSCCYRICSQGATPALPPCFSLIFSELPCGLFLYSSPQMLIIWLKVCSSVQYAELKPVACVTYKDAFLLRESQATDILKQVRMGTCKDWSIQNFPQIERAPANGISTWKLTWDARFM